MGACGPSAADSTMRRSPSFLVGHVGHPAFTWARGGCGGHGGQVCRGFSAGGHVCAGLVLAVGLVLLASPLRWKCFRVNMCSSDVVGFLVKYTLSFWPFVSGVTSCLRCCVSSTTFICSVQSLSRVRLSATPWTAACQAFLSVTNSQSLLKLTPAWSGRGSRPSRRTSG